MALETVHPQYQEMVADWQMLRDVYKGERYVKERRATYLPPTQGMLLDGFGKTSVSNVVNPGDSAYQAYITRAHMPDYFRDAVDIFLGLLHSQPPKLELPEALEPMRENATAQGESVAQLLRRINEEQLVVGRVGLLLDLPRDKAVSPTPYISLYVAEAVRNWDDGEVGTQSKLELVVLDESGNVRTGFQWQWQTKYRVLENSVTTGGSYMQGVFEGTAYIESDMKAPTVRGVAMNEIPFEFVNTKDITSEPDRPVLLGLAQTVLMIYRGEADYRQNLFMQGQDTLVVKGELRRSGDPNELNSNTEGALRTGSGAMIHLNGGSENDAKYIGVNSSGLPEQRMALANDRRRAEGQSAALPTTNPGDQAESGAALKTRVSARTASLNTIALAGAAAVERQLKRAARWIGADPDKVKLTPNLEFADFQMSGDNLLKIMTAKAQGAPLSLESIHALMAEGGVTKLSWQEEQEKLDSEDAMLPPPGTTAGGNPPTQQAPDATGTQDIQSGA